MRWSETIVLFCLDENKKFACFWIKIKVFLQKKPGRSFLILEVIKVYKVKGKNVFHQMAAKNKNVELAEVLLKPLVGF